MQKNIFRWLPIRWLCLLQFSRSFLLMCTGWNFKIEELLGCTVAVTALILLSTWDPLNNFSFSHPLVRTKMTKICLQKENTYQSLTHESSLFLSPRQPFHTLENQLTETHNLNRNSYRYMVLHVGHYERKVEGNISVEEYPIRDILNEWPGMRTDPKVKEVWDKDWIYSRYSLFSVLQDASDLSQEFLHNSEVTSLIPACW